MVENLPVTDAARDPLSEPRPALDAVACAQLLRDGWGITGTLTALHGERDLNFRVVTDDDRRFVLKVHNPSDTTGVIDFQTKAVRHVRQVAPDLPVSDVVPAGDGRLWLTAPDQLGRGCHARLLTYLEGAHPGPDDLGPDDLRRWGQTLARLGRALRGFFHPDAGYPISWDIRRLPALRDWTSVLDDERRAAVLAILTRHEQRVAPVLDRARAQVVHNDFSLDNVLVDARHVITGITDFGDMTHTSLVCDLAVSVADVLAGRDQALELAEHMLAGYVSVTPLEPDEAHVLADLVAGRCAAALTIQAWRQREHRDAAPQPSGGVWRLLGQIESEGIDQVATRLATAALAPARRRRSTADLLDARRRTLGPIELSYQQPLHLVRGSGVHLYAADGRGYVDAYNNVPVLGHSHPAVAAAVSAQVRVLNTNTRYLQDAPVDLAERLLATMPGGYDRVLFVNSGSEANDLAWRIACFTTGASGGIVTAFAYHGITAVTTALSPETWMSAAAPDNVRVVDPPRPRPAGDGRRTVVTAVDELRAAGIGLAAMFVDGVFTSDGILGPAHAWTADAAAAVRAAGGLYVADEVQAGYGRTGDHLWSFAAGNVDADLVTLGKPMGNGFPVAAVVGRSEVVDRFVAETGYFSTFGGGTVACSAALAVLDAIDDEAIVDNARDVGAELVRVLTDIAADDRRLATPRGWGLAVGVDVRAVDSRAPAPDVARRLVNAMRDRGVLIGVTGADESTLKIRPPLVFSRADAEQLAGALRSSLQDLEDSAG